MEERLQNILAHRGVASRRHSASIIEEGRVTVDGSVCTEPGARFDPEKVIVRVDGRVIAVMKERTRTIMMYKPAGVLSSVSDPFGGETVIDLIKGRIRERLVPVGRLDKDSEGLILLSNDGDIALRLTHPRYGHEKVYVVRVGGRWQDEKLDVLRGPVAMPDGYVTRPVPVELVRSQENNVHTLLFRLGEGRKRQIRYMCSAAHLVVLSLKRVEISGLRLDGRLRPGEWRDLTQAEVERLKA